MPNSPSMAMIAMPPQNARRAPSRPAAHNLVPPQGVPVASARRCANHGPSRRGPRPTFASIVAGRLDRWGYRTPTEPVGWS